MLTDKTKKEYLKRAESMKARFEKETGWHLNDGLGLFIDWIRSHVSTWSPATRRFYKAALTYWLKVEGIKFDEGAWNEAFRSSASKKQVREKFGKRTSAKKMKSLKADVAYHVMACLESSRSKWAKLTLNLLEISTTFGLRPYEWAYADFVTNDQNELGIKLKNAKNTQGRSFGEYRTIWINKSNDIYEDEYSESLTQAIHLAGDVINHFKSLKEGLLNSMDEKQLESEYEDQVQRHLQACRLLLGQINARLEKSGAIKKDQRIVLYSARHQFAANAKKSGSSPLEIAALMGHGALDTHQKYYGRKINGKSGFCVSASEEDMTAICDRRSVSDQGMSR